MPLALLALTIGAFAIGTTEFVIVGLAQTLWIGAVIVLVALLLVVLGGRLDKLQRRTAAVSLEG